MKIYFDEYYKNIHTAIFRFGVLKECLPSELITNDPKKADFKILPPFQMSKSIVKILKYRNDKYIVDEWLGTIIENFIEKGHFIPGIRFFEKLREVYFKNSQRIILTSQTYVDYLSKKLPLEKEKFDIFNWVVNTELFRPAENKVEYKTKVGAEEEDLVCVYYGGGFRFHGVEYIMQAIPLILKECDNIRFYFIGPNLGQYRTAELDSKSAFFSDILPKSMLLSYLRASDIFLSSFGSEKTMARVHPRTSLYEAMSCGLVPLASDLPGPKSAIEDGKNGLLIRPADPKDIVEKILYLSEHKHKLETMSKNARGTILKNHSPEYVRKIYKPKFLNMIEKVSLEIHSIT